MPPKSEKAGLEIPPKFLIIFVGAAVGIVTALVGYVIVHSIFFSGSKEVVQVPSQPPRLAVEPAETPVPSPPTLRNETPSCAGGF